MPQPLLFFTVLARVRLLLRGILYEIPEKMDCLSLNLWYLFESGTYSRVALNGACTVPKWNNLLTYITFSPANNFLFLIPFLSGLFSFLTRLLYSSGFRPKIVVHKCIAQATVGTSATVLITSYFIVYGFFVVLFCTYTLPLRKDNMMETIWLSG